MVFARAARIQRQGASRGRGWTEVLRTDAGIYRDGLLHQRDWLQGIGQSGAEVLLRISGVSAQRRPRAPASFNGSFKILIFQDHGENDLRRNRDWNRCWRGYGD